MTCGALPGRSVAIRAAGGRRAESRAPWRVSLGDGFVAAAHGFARSTRCDTRSADRRGTAPERYAVPASPCLTRTAIQLAQPSISRIRLDHLVMVGLEAAVENELALRPVDRCSRSGRASSRSSGSRNRSAGELVGVVLELVEQHRARNSPPRACPDALPDARPCRCSP